MYVHNSFLAIIISEGKFGIWPNIKNNKQLKSTMKRKKMLSKQKNNLIFGYIKKGQARGKCPSTLDSMCCVS